MSGSPAWRRCALRLAPCLLAACASAAPAASPVPNLVLVIGDDHGYADFGFMGSPVARTPELDRLAAGGAVFRFGYNTASICRPSLLSLLTGLHPLQYDAQRAAHRAGERRLPGGLGGAIRDFQTLPRLLAARGYASFQAGKHFEGPYAWAGFSEGMTRDFDVQKPARRLRDSLEPVRGFLDRHAEEPFFLWFAPLLPHVPFDAPREFAERYAGRALPPGTLGYYANVARFDTVLGALLGELRSRGLSERTLVVYLSDNGWQAGELDECCRGLGGPLGKRSLYEIGFRTPVVFHAPGRIRPGTLHDELVSTLDVVVTLLDYAGAPPPPVARGRSLRPLLEGRGEAGSDEIIGHMPAVRADRRGRAAPAGAGLEPGGFFLRTPRWYFVAYDTREPELYDMRADPGQERNVAERHPELVRRFQERIRAWHAELTAPPSQRSSRSVRASASATTR